MKMRTTVACGLGIALALAVLALLLPVLGLITLGLLTLVVPLLVALAPLVVLVPVFAFVALARDRQEPVVAEARASRLDASFHASTP
jgi:hypothetical protein